MTKWKSYEWCTFVSNEWMNGFSFTTTQYTSFSFSAFFSFKICSFFCFFHCYLCDYFSCAVNNSRDSWFRFVCQAHNEPRDRERERNHRFFFYSNFFYSGYVHCALCNNLPRKNIIVVHKNGRKTTAWRYFVVVMKLLWWHYFNYVNNCSFLKHFSQKS